MTNRRNAPPGDVKFTFADWERKYLPRTAAGERGEDDAAVLKRSLLKEAESLLASKQAKRAAAKA